MIWRTIIEVISGFTILVLANVFWSCVKSPRFLGQVLANYDEILKYVNFIGKDKMVEYAINVEKLDTTQVSYADVIRYRLVSSIKAVDKTRNIMVVFIILIIFGSSFLTWYFSLINFGLFLIMGMTKISAHAQNEVFNDLQVIILNIYRWHKLDSVKCKEFCTVDRPRFMNVYKVVTAELLI